MHRILLANGDVYYSFGNVGPLYMASSWCMDSISFGVDWLLDCRVSGGKPTSALNRIHKSFV